MKIFGIGLSKTGTSSLAQALEILGYRTRDYPGLAQYLPGDLATLDPALLENHDALTDTPIPSLYPALDARYPGAKFILTVRGMDGWLKSCQKQFTEKHAAALAAGHHQLFTDLYGCTVFDDTRFRQGYAKFVGEVETYFRDRPDDLLIIDVTAGEGWEKLCPFLGKPIPDLPFPKANVTQIRWMKIEDVIAIAREAAALLPGARATENAPSVTARAGALLQRGFGALRGGRAGALQAGRHAAERHIAQRLHALNAAIPVISSHRSVADAAGQSPLNHFWLLNPLDGDAAAPIADRAISIALIEDRKPIYGVVHAPALDTTYYATQGKGAFRVQGGGAPTWLAPCSAPAHPATTAHAQSGSGSAALTLCRIAEGAPAPRPALHHVQEWEVAAADAILRAVSLRVLDCDTQTPLRYTLVDAAHDGLCLA
jgi:3'-phosphoadenosine 5'-phosphosulfate (PAPS) 3'-phosphatase